MVRLLESNVYFVLVILRRKNHRHEAPFCFRFKFNFAVISKIFFDAGQQIHTPIHMGHFASAESDRYFDLIAAVKEFSHGFGFDFIIMGIDIWSHLDFFERLCALVFAVGRFLFLIFKTHFAVVQHLTNRCESGSNFDEVESSLAGGG